MSLSQLTAKEVHFLLQGINALEAETAEHKLKMSKQLFPADNNLATLIEYYDKRAKELHEVKTKLLGVSTNA